MNTTSSINMEWTIASPQEDECALCEMYEAFFEERPLIPPGCYHEMAFEELEKDPIGETRKLYSALDLPDLREVEAEMQGYLNGLRDYRKNTFAALEPKLEDRISILWSRCIEEWGYAR